MAGAEQTTKGTGYDAFVARYSLDLLAKDAVPAPFSFAPKLNVQPGSQQTSAAAQITGVVGSVPISIVGGNFAQYCISLTSGCLCEVQAFTNVNLTINNNQFVCVRQVAALITPGLARATVIIGGGWGNFLVTTGTEIATPCTLDVDGNGMQDALTDGLMILRALFGLTGTAVTNAAIGDGTPTRTTWAQIQPYLNGNCGGSFAP